MTDSPTPLPLLLLLCAAWTTGVAQDTPPAKPAVAEAVCITPDTTRQHWFGYYDKQQVDPSGRYALGMEADLFLRSPTPADTVDIVVIDLEDGFRKEVIGRSTSWGWQQGCMLQWLPGSREEVIWNDRDGERFVSRIHNVRTGATRTLPRPIYTLSPDGTYALSVDFGRLQYFRPGYGYASTLPLNVDEPAPDDDGIWRMDLSTGASELLASYAEVAAVEHRGGLPVNEYDHWFNHLLVNPTGDRFIFLNRSRPRADTGEASGSTDTLADASRLPERRKYLTRAFTADVDGGGLFPLHGSGIFSHFIWRRSDTLTAWAMDHEGGRPAFYHFPDRTREAIPVDPAAMPVNGHNTYVPGTDYAWVLNDTYPLGPRRLQTLYLYHIPTRRRVDLGHFHEPPRFAGEYRCDLHPRSDQQGRRVFFDSTHEGGKRQMYMIDIGTVVGATDPR